MTGNETTLSSSNMSLNYVTSVTETAEENVYIVLCNITDMCGSTYDTNYATRPDDLFGLNPTIRQWLIDNEGSYTIEPYVPPPPPPIVVPAELFWNRMTDQEAEDIDAEMGTKPVRIRNMFRTATVFRDDNDLWPVLMASLTTIFGATRAGEILAAP